MCSRGEFGAKKHAQRKVEDRERPYGESREALRLVKGVLWGIICVVSGYWPEEHEMSFATQRARGT